MGNRKGLGFHLVFISIVLVTTTYTCFGAQNITVLCSKQERLALLTFKHSVKDDFKMLSSWVGNDCCKWERIQCDGVTGNVESVHLRGDYYGDEGHNYLVGNDVNSSLAELRHLKFLDLSGNDFQGSRIPKFIGSLKQLSYLNLSDAGFQGIIPPHLGNLSNLNVLDLSRNEDLMVDDMAWTFGLSSLEHLDLSTLDLSGAQNFDMVLYMIPSLKELSLSYCGLSNADLGPFLNSTRILSNIQHLDLSRNSFKGVFPHVLTNMSSLRVLDLSRNMLNSPVPIMPNLQELDLSFNEFKQIEHVGIWRHCHLKQLIASYNEFNISMIESPKNISECSRYALERLDLHWSSSGTIPESLGILANLNHLDLSDSKLTGPIPKSLGRLRFLEVLDLFSNHLTGPIPTFLGKLSKVDLSQNQLNDSIPESLGKLATLTDLNLGSNQLTGPIPVSIGQLAKLYSLDISDNSLEGVVSEAHFANLSTMRNLDTSSNTKLTFNVSRGWIPPFQLVTLQLSSCKMENGFPQWLRNQRELKMLVLSNTSISGPLPTWLRKLPIISWLDLSQNKLTGPLTNFPNGGNLDVIGHETGHYAQGQTQHALLLGNNFFNGSIPRSLCRMIDLECLDLSRNMLIGKIPKCFENLQRLITMQFSSNRLSGVIPTLNSSSLSFLALNGNNFTAELPRELGNLPYLSVLDISDNNFYGAIPGWIGYKLTSLRALRLHRNNFTGIIPLSLCKIPYLQILDVAYNDLTGTIPHCLAELNTMMVNICRHTINSDENMIQVSEGIDFYLKIWNMVCIIDLSSNKLMGEIPVELTELSMLMGFNLSNNHLSGGIPDSIGNMTNLESLDFSRNELTGMIPQSMVALTCLSYLNLSHNNLWGRIPTGNQLQTMTDTSYAGNKDLCGPPLPNNCSDHEESKTHEPMKVWLVWLFYLDIFCGFATGFWGFIGVLLFKKQWRYKFFRFVEETMDTIHVAVVVRFNMMKRGREAL